MLSINFGPWKTREVIHHDTGNGECRTEWQVTGEDGYAHTFFTMYNIDDWVFFIENIRKFLNPGGRALIQPAPLWDGYALPYYKLTGDYLQRFNKGDYLEIKK